jgi:hypothetical protein
MVIGQRSQGPYETTSADKPVEGGHYAIVRFTPGASAAEIEALLDANRVTIVDGPRPGGLYRVRIAELPQDSTVQYRDVGRPLLAEEHRDQTIAKLRAATRIVSFAAPGE